MVATWQLDAVMAYRRGTLPAGAWVAIILVIVLIIFLSWYFSASSRLKRQLKAAKPWALAELPEDTHGRVIGRALPLMEQLASHGMIVVAPNHTGNTVNDVLGDTQDPFEQVAVTFTDTGYGPYDASTGARRSTTMSGLAVQRATKAIRDRVIAMAAGAWECSEDDVDIIGGEVRGPGSSELVGHFVGEHFGQRGGNFIGVGEVTAHEFPTTPAFWEVAAAVADVSVDTATGQVAIDAYRSMADVGRAVNPMLMEGQEEGAIVQGIGHTMYEELQWQDSSELGQTDKECVGVPDLKLHGLAR